MYVSLETISSSCAHPEATLQFPLFKYSKLALLGKIPSYSLVLLCIKWNPSKKNSIALHYLIVTIINGYISYFCMSSITSVLILAILIAIVLF